MSHPPCLSLERFTLVPPPGRGAASRLLPQIIHYPCDNMEISFFPLGRFPVSFANENPFALYAISLSIFSHPHFRHSRFWRKRKTKRIGDRSLCQVITKAGLEKERSEKEKLVHYWINAQPCLAVTRSDADDQVRGRRRWRRRQNLSPYFLHHEQIPLGVRAHW